MKWMAIQLTVDAAPANLSGRSENWSLAPHHGELSGDQLEEQIETSPSAPVIETSMPPLLLIVFSNVVHAFQFQLHYSLL
jgi:hypothetical protein